MVLHASLRQSVRLLRYVRSRSFSSCGTDVHFDPFGVYWPSNAMHFGAHVFIGRGARIEASAGFYVGSYVLIAPDFCVMGGDHNFRELGKRMWDVTTGGVNLPVVIEDDVWIGARVTVLKGVRIGRGSVIGAASVVTKSIPPFSVAVGNPCRVVRRRFSDQELEAHLRLLGDARPHSETPVDPSSG